MAGYEQVLIEYFDCVDRGDGVGASQVFTPDARSEIMTGKVLEGRERIGRALNRVLVAYERTSHHLTNVREETDGDRVILHSYVYAYHRMVATGAAWHLWARMHDILVQHEGKWLIADHKLMGVDAAPLRRDIPVEWYEGHPGREWGRLPHAGDRLRDAIEVAAPKAAEGMARIRRAAEEAGALAAGEKALVTACAAAARGQLTLAGDALARARAAELPPEQAWAAAAVLLISRGEAAAERLAQALLETYGTPPPGTPSSGPVGRDAAFEYFRDYFGEVPERVALLADRAPGAFEGYTLMHQGALRESPLPPALVELILCGVNAADFQTEFVSIHADAARRVGASEAQLLEAIVAVIPVSGVAVWPGAAAALLRS